MITQQSSRGRVPGCFCHFDNNVKSGFRSWKYGTLREDILVYKEMFE